jgi:hypothetical protein
MQITDKKTIQKIASDISTLGTKYIVDMIKLCDKYEIDRDSTLEKSVADLENLVKKFSFVSMNVNDKEWDKKMAEIDNTQSE